MRAHMEHLPEPPPGRRLVRKRTRTCAPGIGDLARQIEIEHKAAVDAWDNVIERASACGRLLLQAKERVGHGNWLAWLAEHTTITPRMAQRYTRIYQYREQLSADATRVSHLSVRAAVALLSKPRETPTPPTASDPAVPARAPAANARATPAAPAPRTPTRLAAPDHFVQLQNALGVFATLPKPDVLAHVVARRRVDTADMLRQLTNASQYITSFARELGH